MTAASTALTTGWEADLPIADTVLRRFVFAHADRLCRLAACTGGRTESWAGARLVDLASPVPFDNAAVLLRPPTAVDLATVAARARSFFPAGRAWVLFSAWPTPDLSALGLRLVGHPPLMLRPAGPWPAPPACATSSARWARRTRCRSPPAISTRACWTHPRGCSSATSATTRWAWPGRRPTTAWSRSTRLRYCRRPADAATVP